MRFHSWQDWWLDFVGINNKISYLIRKIAYKHRIDDWATPEVFLGILGF